MTYLVQLYKGKKASSVNEVISVIKEYLDSETSLEVELIYFTSYVDELNYLY